MEESDDQQDSPRQLPKKHLRKNSQVLDANQQQPKSGQNQDSGSPPPRNDNKKKSDGPSNEDMDDRESGRSSKSQETIIKSGDDHNMQDES